MKKTTIFRLAIFCIVVIYSCSKPATPANTSSFTEDCSGSIKSFTHDVDPIVQTRCNKGGCHASGSVNGPGPLTNYTQVFNNRNVIRMAISSGEMPQDGSLNAAEKNAILCWIDNGAAQN